MQKPYAEQVADAKAKLLNDLDPTDDDYEE
jgi:hypothetical protein